MQFGPGFAATFLYYFTSTAVIFTLVASQALGLSLQTNIPQQLGAIGGLAAGLIGAYFNRTITLTVPVQNQQEFLTKLNETLAQLGYQQSEELEDQIWVYQRSGLSKAVSGKVFVQLEAGSATIASRAIQLNAIRKQIER